MLEVVEGDRDLENEIKFQIDKTHVLKHATPIYLINLKIQKDAQFRFGNFLMEKYGIEHAQ